MTDDLLANVRRCFATSSPRRRRPNKKRRIFQPSRLRRVSLSGCSEVTSYGLEVMQVHQTSLEELDLSGCYKVDGETLRTFAEGCPRLRPAALFYCNDIEDGPFPEEAGGCLNLECGVRACCQQMKN